MILNKQKFKRMSVSLAMVNSLEALCIKFAHIKLSLYIQGYMMIFLKNQPKDKIKMIWKVLKYMFAFSYNADLRSVEATKTTSILPNCLRKCVLFTSCLCGNYLKKNKQGHMVLKQYSESMKNKCAGYGR